MKKLFAIMIFSGMIMSESISSKTKDMNSQSKAKKETCCIGK